MNLSNQYPSLTGKTVFITGGATGIGANLVEAFYRQAAQVVFVDIQDDAATQLINRLKEIKSKTQAAYTTPKYFHCNLVDIDALKNIIARTETEIGPIGVLINNAASDLRHDFRDVTEEFWNQRININLRHQFFAIQAVYQQMKKLGGGSIINFGSMSWYECQGGMTGYTTSKAAIEGLTRGMARDLGQDNIRINTLTPGWVMTERQLRDWVNEDTEKEIQRAQCLKEKLMPENISAMALFLASDDSCMCTAQNFIVDGGWI